MLSKFRTKELVVCALFGALGFVLAFVLGSAIVVATGTPGAGGFANVLIVYLLMTTGSKIINRTGSITLMFTILSILAIPTVILGPPGIYKIAIGFAMGLSFDIIVYLSKNKKIGYVVGGAISADVMLFTGALFVILLNLPGTEKFMSLLYVLLIIYPVLSIIGAYLGLWLFDKKLKNKAFVRQMQN